MKAHASGYAGQPVLNREYKEWQQTGFRHGSTQFYPELTINGHYTDNLRAAAANRKSDLVTSLSAALRVKTHNQNQGLIAIARVEQQAYARTASENNTNAGLHLAPYYHVTRALTLKADLAYQRRHELRNADNNNPLAKEPTPYDQSGGKLSILYDPGRIGTELFVRHEELSFENVSLLNGGTFINDDRDRALDETGMELFYRVSDLTRLGWRNEIYRQNYERADYSPVTMQYDGPARDYQGWRSQLSFDLQPDPLWRIKGMTGLDTRSFDNPAWSDRKNWIGSVQVTYLLTPLTNVIFDAERFIGDTAFDNAAAFIQNHGKATLVHELKRNLIVSLDAGYGEAAYWDNARRDSLYDNKASLTYKQNDHIHWQAGYRHQERDSSVNAASYQENIVSIGAKVLF